MSEYEDGRFEKVRKHIRGIYPPAFQEVLDSSLGQCNPKNTSRFEETGAEIGALVAEKNAAYGDSSAKSGEIMRILYPFGIRTEDMDDVLAVVRVVDKLFRIATRKDAFGESPWRDVAGYGILGAVKDTLGTSVPKCEQPSLRDLLARGANKGTLGEDGDPTGE